MKMPIRVVEHPLGTYCWSRMDVASTNVYTYSCITFFFVCLSTISMLRRVRIEQLRVLWKAMFSILSMLRYPFDSDSQTLDSDSSKYNCRA